MGKLQELLEPLPFGLPKGLYGHPVVGPTQDGADSNDQQVYEFMLLVPVDPRICQPAKVVHEGCCAFLFHV